jgi:hypothetical protein
MVFTGPMSSCLNVYAIEPSLLWRAWGSNDARIADRALAADEDLVDQWRDLLSPKAPTPEQAIADFVAGATPHMAWVTQNWWVVQLLCAAEGDPLDGDTWTEINADTVELVGELLAAEGVEIDLWKLFKGGPPDHIPLANPYVDRDPRCGFLDAAEVARFAPVLEPLLVFQSDDDWEQDLVRELAGWFARARALGSGLAFFCG